MRALESCTSIYEAQVPNSKGILVSTGLLQGSSQRACMRISKQHGNYSQLREVRCQKSE